MPCRLVVLTTLIVALNFGNAVVTAEDVAWVQAESVDTLYYEDLGPVANFRLTDQRGRTITLDDLRGKIWVASFFYSTCPECPTKHMPNLKQLYQDLAKTPDVLLVSFSVNPEQDDPDLLAKYAASFGADPERWLFLTGPKNEVYDLVEKSFKLVRPFEVKTEAREELQIIHPFRIALVDADGAIVGVADGADAAELPRIEKRLKGLVQAERLRSGYYFPTLNASLNALSGVLLVVGYVLVRQRRLQAHKIAMLSALGVSILFLGCYLFYHMVIRHGEPTYFLGQGWSRTAYLAILLSHTVLAAVVAPLALIVAYLGVRDRRTAHVRLARWTLPLWLYVSATGVVVYWMLYHL